MVSDRVERPRCSAQAREAADRYPFSSERPGFVSLPTGGRVRGLRPLWGDKSPGADAASVSFNCVFMIIRESIDSVRAAQGSLSGGHYTAHVKVSPCSSFGEEEASVAFDSNERWLHIDDDLVEAAKPEDVVTDGAYVLFYRRRRLSGRLVVGHTTVAPVV